MKTLLFIGGEAPLKEDARLDLTQYGFICAADSGANTAKAYGAKPDLIIGDMDSIGLENIELSFPGAEILRFDSYKDYTDTELALSILQERGFFDITIVGGGGGRLDHLLALLRLFDRSFCPKKMYAGDYVIELVEDKKVFSFKIAELVSVFPCGDALCKPYSSGLEWPLNGLIWKHSDFGISNRATKEVVEIGLTSGRALVVFNIHSVK